MKGLFLFIIEMLFFSNIYAEHKPVWVSFSAGGVSKLNSLEKDSLYDKPIIRYYGGASAGVGADFFFFERFSLAGSYDISIGSANSQYVDGLGTMTPNLHTVLFRTNFDVGLRFRPINGNFFKLFFGGGGMVGASQFRYSTDEYKAKNGGSDFGLEEVEMSYFTGYYYETGFEFIEEKYGIRVSAKGENSKSSRIIETLGNSKLTLNNYRALLSVLIKIK